MAACNILVCWHRVQCYCLDEVSDGVASTTSVIDMAFGQSLLVSGTLVRKVSLCYRVLRMYRHNQVFFLLKMFSEGQKESCIVGNFPFDIVTHRIELPHL